VGFLRNQKRTNGCVLEEKTKRSRRNSWKEEGNDKVCVDEASTVVSVFHSFHK
jgi:hypothetical protein